MKRYVTGLVLAESLMLLMLWVVSMMPGAVHAAEIERIPSVTMDCQELGTVTFWNTGALTGEHVDAEYVTTTNNTVYFTNGIKLRGVLIKNILVFDTAILTTRSGEFACAAR